MGIKVPALKARLDELCASGLLPLVSMHEHPHVDWSILHSWFPGGLYLTSSQARQLLRLLAYTARTIERAEMLILARSAGLDRVVVVTKRHTDEEHRLRLIERSANERAVLAEAVLDLARGAFEPNRHARSIRSVTPNK